MNLVGYNKAVRDSTARFAKDIGPHERDEFVPWGHLGPRRRIPMRPHATTVLHDDGLYRHVLCKSPDHGTYWFELITVPGSLTFRGDGESFVFAREKDMFDFFRSHKDSSSINPTYWSEKLTSERNASFKYDQGSFRAQVWEHVRLYGGEYRGLAKAVQEHFFGRWSEYDTGYEEAARAGLDAFSYTPDDGLKPFAYVEQQPFTFGDTCEWDFKGFDWWFLWACHAIVWGIARYDEARAASAVAA